MMLPLKQIILLYFLSRSLASNGQNTTTDHLDSLVAKCIVQLKSNGIDSILIFQDYWPGSEVVIKDNKENRCHATIYMPTYILWTKNGTSYLTKKDNCFDYSTIEINMQGI
jgi:hypothetical protein